MTTPDRELWTYTCSECGGTKHYRDDINELPEGWHRVEDRMIAWVVCSPKCLVALAQGIAAPLGEDA